MKIDFSEIKYRLTGGLGAQFFPVQKNWRKSVSKRKACNGKQILDHKLIVERKAEQIKINGSLKTNNNVNKLSWVISKLAAGPPRQ